MNDVKTKKIYQIKKKCVWQAQKYRHTGATGCNREKKIFPETSIIEATL